VKNEGECEKKIPFFRTFATKNEPMEETLGFNQCSMFKAQVICDLTIYELLLI